jgi:lipid-binding SYLF domain-containing protein
MKPFRYVLLIVVLIFMATTVTAASEDGYANAMRVFKWSPVVKPYFETAYGYALFPTIGKGAFYLGAAYGNGRVYRGHKPTGTSAMVQLSLGFQMGGRAFSEIIFFEDKRAYEDFTSGNFEFDASASVTAVTAEAQAKATTTGNTAGASAGPATSVRVKTSYYKGMATFVHAKGGLMFDASVGGQKFSFKPL